MKNFKVLYTIMNCVFIIGLLGFTAPLGLLGLPQLQTNGPWSPPIQLSSPQAGAWFPDIIADSSGRVHLVWSSGVPGYDQVIYTSTTNGSQWSQPNDILGVPANVGESAVTRPSLWIDREGFLDIAYGGAQKFFTFAPLSQAGLASSWAPPVILNNGQIGYFTKVMEDAKGTLHIFYTENKPSSSCTDCYHLYYRSSVDHGHTWADSIDISQADEGSAKPQAITDKAGNIFVVWESGIGGSLGAVQDPTLVKFAASYDHGKTWTRPLTLSPDQVSISKNVTLGIDPQGSLVVVWLDPSTDIVYYQTSKDLGKSWSVPGKVQGVYGAWGIYPSLKDDYSLAADSQGNLHLLMVGKVKDYQTSLSVVHSVWDGLAWSNPDEVTRLTGDVPEWPRIAISQGNILNATWFVRDQANIWKSDSGHYQVWYSRKVISAPAIPTTLPKTQATPAAVSTTSPTPAATLSQATSLQLATLAPADKVPSKIIYSENDYLKVIAISAVPVILFIAIAGVIIFLRRA